MTSSKIPGARESARIRVLCVDHHQIILAGIAATLKSDSRVEIVGLVDGMPEALQEFVRLRPDIVLTELSMPDFPGVEPVRAFVRIDPLARVVVLTSAAEDARISQALEAGAAGFLLKSRSVGEIGDSIEAVFSGARVLDPGITRDVGTAVHRQVTLDAPEIEALRLLAKGTRTLEVARSLHIDLAGTRALLSSAVRKLGATNRTHAVMLAKERGLIDEG